jgi:hypothetical protein
MMRRKPIVRNAWQRLSFVMPGLVPGIHVLAANKAWMAGPSPGHDYGED